MASGEDIGRVEESNANSQNVSLPRRVIKRRGQQSGQKSPLSTPKGKSASESVGMTSDTLQELLTAADEEEANRSKVRPRRRRSKSPSEAETMKITVSLQLSPPQDQEAAPEGSDSKVEDAENENREDGVVEKKQDSEVVDGEVQDESSDVDMSKATDSLRIDGFTRPLLTKALQELLAKYGTVVTFWLQGIKKYCLVTYENKEQAAAALTGIDGTSWPEESRPKLTVSFVTTQEVQEASAVKSQTKTAEKESRPTKALDELFRRTKTKPAVYWLPLTAEEIARKEKELKKRTDKDKDKPNSEQENNTNNKDRRTNKRDSDKEKKIKRESNERERGGNGRANKRRRAGSPSAQSSTSKKPKSKSRSPSSPPKSKNESKEDTKNNSTDSSAEQQQQKTTAKVEPGSPKSGDPSIKSDSQNSSTKKSSRSSSPRTTKMKKPKPKRKRSSSSSRSRSNSPDKSKSKKGR